MAVSEVVADATAVAVPARPATAERIGDLAGGEAEAWYGALLLPVPPVAAASSTCPLDTAPLALPAVPRGGGTDGCIGIFVRVLDCSNDVAMAAVAVTTFTTPPVPPLLLLLVVAPPSGGTRPLTLRRTVFAEVPPLVLLLPPPLPPPSVALSCSDSTPVALPPRTASPWLSELTALGLTFAEERRRLDEICWHVPESCTR